MKQNSLQKKKNNKKKTEKLYRRFEIQKAYNFNSLATYIGKIYYTIFQPVQELTQLYQLIARVGLSFSPTSLTKVSSISILYKSTKNPSVLRRVSATKLRQAIYEIQ